MSTSGGREKRAGGCSERPAAAGEPTPLRGDKGTGATGPASPTFLLRAGTITVTIRQIGAFLVGGRVATGRPIVHAGGRGTAATTQEAKGGRGDAPEATKGRRRVPVPVAEAVSAIASTSGTSRVAGVGRSSTPCQI